MARRKVGRGSALTRQEGPASTPAAAAGVVVPFNQGSKPEVEEGPAWLEQLPGANAINLGPIALPANGYIAAVCIDVETAEAGKGGALEASEDFPWNIFELIKLTEPNNAPLGMELTGYQAYVANKYGVYAGAPDPTVSPVYSATAASPSFMLRIPVQIAPNGLGSLGNQSAAAALRLFLRINPATVAWKKAGEAYPKLNIRTYIELWGEPPGEDLLGRQVQQEPMFEGTCQMWTAQNQEKFSAGKNNTKMTQLGAMIRTIAFVCRNAGGERKDTVFPNPFQVQLDNRTFRTASQRWLIETMREETPQIKERDAGVFVMSFSKGETNESGANQINSWLATLNATRLELLGSSAVAGNVDILTNFITVTASNPEERTLQVGRGGLHPPVGVSSEVAA
jgi:hypothetical protein